MPVDGTGAAGTVDTGTARTVDLRSLEAPPFDAVVAALGELSAGETVEFVVGFAPVPLYDLLEARGWRYEAVHEGPDEWRVLVEPVTDDDLAADSVAGRDSSLSAPTDDPERTRSGRRVSRPRTYHST